MNTKHLFPLLLSLLPGPALAAARTTASYSIPAETMDAGGSKTTTAAYRNDGCVGTFGGISTVAAPSMVVKHSFIGQLYETASLALSATPATVRETATRQLTATATMDDTSTLRLPAADVAWSVVNGPIASINASGLATAQVVYQDTPATVRGTVASLSATLGLLVQDVNRDNFGTYAGDGIDDAWQVQYFGLNNPNAGPNGDPDGDQQNNRFEFVAGTIPTDGNSRFRFRIEAVPGQPTRKNLIFSPRWPDRIYEVVRTLEIAPASYEKVADPSVSDAGPERTVTDLTATEAHKFYRVQITKP